MDLDEQRAQVAHALAQRRRRVAQRGGRGVVAAALRVGGQRREAERDAREVLHHPVVQIGGDPPALLRDASAALDSSASRSRWPRLQAPRHRPGQRHLEEHEHDDAADERRGQRAEQPRAAGV